MASLKDKERQILLERYCDIEWSDDVSDLRCVHCQRVAINNCVSSCQHIFCKTCSKFYNDEEHPLNCPQCQEHISQLDDKDFDVEVKIHQLRIFCPNKKYGCTHEDQLKKMPSHLSICPAARESTLPEKATVELTSVDDAIGALREKATEEVEEKLNEVDTKTNKIDRTLNRSERKINNKVKVLTAKKTKVGKKAKEMESASKECSKQFQSTKSLLELINERVQKIELDNQPTMEEMNPNMDDVWTEIDSAIKKSPTLQSRTSEQLNIQKSEAAEWTVAVVKKTIRKQNWTFESEEFKFTGYKYGIQAQMEKKQGIMAIHLRFEDGETINQHLKEDGFTKIKYVIRDQENTDRKNDVILEAELAFFDNFTNPDWIFEQALPNAILHPPYTKDNRMKIEMLFEPPSIDHSFVSDNGVLVWTVDTYASRKQRGWRCVNWSPSFYTSPRGYRVKARLIIWRSHPLELAVYFLTGEHDDSLSNRWPHRTTVILFNQSNSSTVVLRRKFCRYVMPYTIYLGGIELIEEDGFVKDDSMQLKVVIESLGNE